MSATSLLGLPLIDAAQSQKHVTHNSALLQLDGIVHLAVASRNATSPPASPDEGDRYLVGTGATGAFATQANAVALWQSGAWVFLVPKSGWRAYVAAENLLVVFDGTQWRDPQINIPSLQNLTSLGIGTTADTTNRFAAKSNSMLLTARTSAEGGSGDLRVALNKAASMNTGSFVLQTNWSGRAEFGLAGDDHFRVKVSADGTAWATAIDIDPGTARVNLPGGFASGCIATSAQAGVVKAGPLVSVAADGTLAPQLGAWTNVASAATIDLGAQASLNLVITGTTSISSFGTTATTHGLPYTPRFAGALTLVNGATLILPGAANITTSAGDIADAVWEGTGVWRVISYQRASGAALSGGGASGLTGFRNRIINGDMRVWQRGTSFSGGGYTADRMLLTVTAGAVTAAQTGGPSGFASALSITATAANTAISLGQRIEAANVADLAGQTVTVSLWVKSSAALASLTAQIFAPSAADNFASGTWSGPFNCLPAIPANVWTYVTATTTLPAGCVNGAGLNLGSVALAAGASLAITGLQIETGAMATAFERRPIGTELGLCQRSYWQSIPANAFSLQNYAGASGVWVGVTLQHPSAMRASPTMGGSLVLNGPLSNGTFGYVNWQLYGISALTTGTGGWSISNSSPITASAEL